jgi:SAM-dependent methyltransferase
MLDDLHASLLPILRHVLANTPLPRRGLVLDLACGAGEKTALLAEALGPGVRLLGLDIDRGAMRDGRPKTEDRRPKTEDEQAPPQSTVHRPPSTVCADAHALPLRDTCLDAAVCIAALGLFAEPVVALRELRRTLRPGAPALVVTATQLWARVTRLPPGLARLLVSRRRGAAHETPRASADVAGELEALLADAGFRAARARGFLLEPGEPALLELALAPWPALRPLAASLLAPTDLARCDERAADAEVELVPVALAGLAAA